MTWESLRQLLPCRAGAYKTSSLACELGTATRSPRTLSLLSWLVSLCRRPLAVSESLVKPCVQNTPFPLRICCGRPCQQGSPSSGLTWQLLCVKSCWLLVMGGLVPSSPLLECPVSLLLLQNLLLVYLVSQLISTPEHRKQVLHLT